MKRAFVNASDPLVDNNELFGWSHAAVYFADTIEGRVRGNHLHHNRRTGLGYGVVMYNNSSAVIEDNTFTQNRHAIAGNGLRTQRYDARFNVVTDNANGHGFDVHGENEALSNGAPYAGDVVRITQNSFRSSAQRAVVIRGRPFTGAWVSGNCFAHTTQSAAVQQTNFTGNMFIVQHFRHHDRVVPHGRAQGRLADVVGRGQQLAGRGAVHVRRVGGRIR